jgi:D-glycero-D-manno-heptose 1,7-bisphosphate phosphatase
VLEGSKGVILLDRDGVLNVDRTDSVTSVGELALESGAVEATAQLQAAGYRLVVITNQSAVGRGRLSQATSDAINDELNRRLGGTISAFFVCPHAPDEGCACRKPGTLLFELARDTWEFDPAETWFVLDADRDIEAAQKFGCRPVLVRTGKGRETERHHPEVPAFDNLLDFAKWLFDDEKPR